MNHIPKDIDELRSLTGVERTIARIELEKANYERRQRNAILLKKARRYDVQKRYRDGKASKAIKDGCECLD